MKKIITICGVICILLCNTIPAYAAPDTDLNENLILETYKEIEEIKDIEAENLEDINSTLTAEGMLPIEKGDIDYNKAIRVYAGMSSILNSDELSNKELLSCLENSDYFYYIPISNNGKTMLLNVQRRGELTEEGRNILDDEQISAFEKKIGEWIIPVMSIYDYTIDYKAEVETVMKENNINNAYVYYLGGISKAIDLAAAICPVESENVEFKILKQFEQQTQDDGGSNLDQNILHSFYDIKDVASKDIPLGFGESGASGNVSWQVSKELMISVIGIVLIATVVITVLVIRKKKKTKNMEF